jgi:hypothetical protein
MKLQTQGHTFVFRVSDNGVPYEEIYNGPPLLTQFIVPGIVHDLATQQPSPVYMRGGFTAPVGSPSASLKIDLWDDDTFVDDLVGGTTVVLEIPTGIPGSPSIWFDEVTTLWAQWDYFPARGYVVCGVAGSSGETVADLFFTVIDDTGTAVIGPSPTKTVTAQQ